MRFKKVLTGLFILTRVAAAMAGSALAGAWSYTSMGGKVVMAGKTITLHDVKDDGRFVATEFRYNKGRSSSAIANKLGYGRSTGATVDSDITNAKICRSNPFPLPVDCGSWKF